MFGSSFLLPKPFTQLAITVGLIGTIKVGHCFVSGLYYPKTSN